MKKGIGFLSLCLAALVLLILASCATTKLLTVWKDESFQGTIRKVAVVGVFSRPAIRNLFEDEFVRQLKARGVDAVASYTFLPADELSHKELVISKIKESGVDAALVTRLVDRKTVESYVPGQVYAVPRPYYYWGPYFDYIYQPGYMVREEYAYAETNIYDTTNEKLIWAARSQTLLSGSDSSLIQSFVRIMTDKMAEDGLIR